MNSAQFSMAVDTITENNTEDISGYYFFFGLGL